MPSPISNQGRLQSGPVVGLYAPCLLFTLPDGRRERGRMGVKGQAVKRRSEVLGDDGQRVPCLDPYEGAGCHGDVKGCILFCVVSWLRHTTSACSI